MKKTRLFVAAMLLVAQSQAAVKVRDERIDGEMWRPAIHQRYAFQMDVVSDQEGAKPETYRSGEPFVAAQPGERYSIRLTNPLPVRVAVNLTVDGLNSISGKPCGIADGPKWLIEPYSSITIAGWQVNGAEARRFFFTEKNRSYAAWRETQTGRALKRNCGVIGAAFFWNGADLAAAVRPPEPDTSYESNGISMKDAMPEAKSSAARAAAAPPQAGTGMGERLSHPTQDVAFHYDAGMYRPADALVIYYDFVRAPARPDPFPGDRFAPEAPLAW